MVVSSGFRPSVRRISVLFLVLLAVRAGAADPPAGDLGEVGRLAPVEVADVQKTFAVQHGFTLELVAHEPLVNDPVDGCFDEHGNLYIAEMRGYPYSAEPRPPQQPLPIGRKDVCKVRKLVDANRDGIFEGSTVFAEGLSWVVSVCCFDGGVFVLAPSSLYYFKDTTGDGVADLKQVVASGFGRGNVQAMANNLKWGPDGKIYFAGGMIGGEITIFSPAGAEIQKLTVRGNDLRFDPWTRQFEPVNGGQQFGNCFDDWGERYVCSNSNHIQRVNWPLHPLEQLSELPSNPPVQNFANEGPAAPVFRKSPAEPWRIVRTRRRASDPEMKKRLPMTELVPIGFFTSATGVTIYRGDAYPPEFHGNAFIGDVGGNLIHRKKMLTHAGSPFSQAAARADDGVEFVTSTDTWFRPANFINGPDGCLYVCDMYRETIEHPFSIPEDIKAKLDLESGTDRGRIYRLTPPGGAKTDWKRPADCSTEELIELLASTNGWHRETAQRLLLERRDPAAISPLHSRARTKQLAVGQMLAVRTLAALGEMNSCDVFALLHNPDPRAHVHAIERGVEHLVAHPNFASLRDRLLDTAGEESYEVRTALALGLSRISGPGVDEAWVQLATENLTDTNALLASARDRAALVQLLLGRQSAEKSLAPLLIQLVRLGGTRGDDAEVQKLLQALLADDWQLGAAHRWSLVATLGEGLRSRGKTLLAVLGPEQHPAFDRICDEAIAQLPKEGAYKPAVALLAFAPPEKAIPALITQVNPRAMPTFQAAVITALGDLPGSAGAVAALDKWKELSPELRRATVEILLRDRARVDALLAAVTDQRVKASELSTEQWQSLLGHPDLPVRERATTLRGQVSADREAVIAQYREAVEAGGDIERGRAVFKKTCSVCHKVGDVGHNVGPELASVANKSPADLLVAILDPNREAQPKFVNYTLETTQGQVFTGLLAAESSAYVTLRRSEAKEDTIAREAIETLTSSGVSLMPVGVEKDLKPQEIADVIAFVRGLAAAQP
jgi:putative membrane-bound dehydrogenase-like protein